MHDGDELWSEPSLDIMGNMLNDGGDGVPSGEQRVHNDAEVFYLEIDFVQSFKGAPIIEVVVERHGEVGVSDGSDEGQVFDGIWERAESMAVDEDINLQDGEDFYSRQQ